MDENTQKPRANLFDWKVVLKERRFVLGIVATLGALLVLWVITTFFGSVTGINQNTSSNSGSMMDYSVSESADYVGAPMDADYARVSSKVATRQIIPPTRDSGGTGSYDEAEYETRNYNAYIKTQEYEKTCNTIESWKPLQHVIFEQANRGDSYCSYTFKVESASAQKMLEEIQKLDPRDLSEQTEVIKRQLLEYTSELEILKKQEDLLLQTLEDVSKAYDELVTLSKQAKDVETLAKVIDGKLRYMEQLSQQRLQVSAQIDSIARAKSEFNDRIEFVYFGVSVEKIEYINGEQIRDSWISAVKRFVTNINNTLQQITFGILALILWLIQALLQAIILFIVVLVVGKYGWRATKKFWQS